MSIAVNRPSFQEAYNQHLQGRKQVSNGMYLFLRILVVIFTSCAVAMAASYAWQLGESWFFKAVIVASAVGLELAIVFFSAVIYPAPFLSINKLIAGTLLPLLSLFTFMSFMFSQYYASENKAHELRAEYAKTLKADAASMSAAQVENRASLQITRNRLESAIAELEAHKDSRATHIYHAIEHATGLNADSVMLLIRFLWGLCFVSLCIALDAYVDTRLYSEKSLRSWIKTWQKSEAAFNAALKLATGTKPSLPEPKVQKPEEKPVVSTPKPKPEKPVVIHKSVSAPRRKASRGPQGPSYEEVRDRILSGKSAPSIRAIKALGVGAGKANEYLKKLESERVIVREKKGYVRHVQ